MQKYNIFTLLAAFVMILPGTPALSQHHHHFGAAMEEVPERDLSGTFRGTWTDLYKKKGEVEIKIYSQYSDTYVGSMKLTDKNGKIFTGMLTISLTGDYFNGYYTPSAYASGEDASALECQLMIQGKLIKEKKGYLFKGEGVSASCYENNILEIELKEEELLAEATKSGK